MEIWIQEAAKTGAKILTGGTRNGAFVSPTILTNVAATCQLNCEEVFGPVCVIHTFDKLSEVIKSINSSRYGLQAGIFTSNINQINYTFENLHVGGVVVNDVPSARVDSMPYGGIKDSGVGREGIVYAMEEMSEMKVILMKNTGYTE